MPESRSMTLHGHRLSYTDSSAHRGSDTTPDTDRGPDRDSANDPSPQTAAILLVHGLMSSVADLGGSGGSARGPVPGDRTRPLRSRRIGEAARRLFARRRMPLPCATSSTRLDIAKVTVVGHSLGGGVALQFAYLFPDRVDALVLVSSGGLGREVNPLLRAATLPGSEIVLPLSPRAGCTTSAIPRCGTGRRLGLPPISPSSDEAWRNLPTLADGATRAAFLATSRSVINVGGQTVAARDRLPGLRSRPSLLIWGARDRIVPSSHLENARAELPDAQVEIFDRAGHFPHLDEPDRFATVLSEFLDGRVRPAGSRGRRAGSSNASPAPSRQMTAVNRKISLYWVSSAAETAALYSASCSVNSVLVDAERQWGDQRGGQLTEPVQAPPGESGHPDQHAGHPGHDHGGRGDPVRGRRHQPEHRGGHRGDHQPQAEPGDGQVGVRHGEAQRMLAASTSAGQREISRYPTAATTQTRHGHRSLAQPGTRASRRAPRRPAATTRNRISNRRPDRNPARAASGRTARHRPG